MSDVQPQECFGVAFGVTVSGQTQPYDLGGDSIGGQVRAVQAVSAVSAVSGSVLRSGDQVRISAKLVDARSGNLMWAETYDRDLRDILKRQLSH